MSKIIFGMNYFENFNYFNVKFHRGLKFLYLIFFDRLQIKFNIFETYK